MCGLTGILSPSSSKNVKDLIKKMTSFIIHRGPDSEGFWYNNNMGLGHRRLAIVDLSSTGAQPMKSHCGRYVIAYNGEIYNHLELREQIQRDGGTCEWQGHSDTETLLASICHWGLDDALNRSHGMFPLLSGIKVIILLV